MSTSVVSMVPGYGYALVDIKICAGDVIYIHQMYYRIVLCCVVFYYIFEGNITAWFRLIPLIVQY